LHGFKRALIFVLRAAWTSMEQYSGLACPVPGIIAAPATTAASRVEAAMPHSTAGHGADAAEWKALLIKKNVQELKGLLKEKGLNRTGKKMDLVDRLCPLYCTTAAPVAATAAEALSGEVSVGEEYMEPSEGASGSGGAAAAPSDENKADEKDKDSSEKTDGSSSTSSSSSSSSSDS
jgi:hypothetical protein